MWVPCPRKVTQGILWEFTGKNCSKIHSSSFLNGVERDHRSCNIFLIFVYPGIEIKQKFNLDDILQNEFKQFAQKHFSGGNWVYLQDFVPAHRALEIFEWLISENIDFISRYKWPANTFNISPTIFSVWRILKAKFWLHSIKVWTVWNQNWLRNGRISRIRYYVSNSMMSQNSHQFKIKGIYIEI